MTQIANARSFDGVDDRIDFTLGGLSGAWSSGVTVMATVKPDSTRTPEVSGHRLLLARCTEWHNKPPELRWLQGEKRMPAPVERRDGHGNRQAGFDPDDGLQRNRVPRQRCQPRLQRALRSSMAARSRITTPSATIPVRRTVERIGFTKASGSSTARLHNYKYSTTTWTHSNGEGGALPDPGSPTAMVMANSNDSNFYKGLIACVGVWKASNLSDGNVETLENDIANWTTVTNKSLATQSNEHKHLCPRQGGYFASIQCYWYYECRQCLTFHSKLEQIVRSALYRAAHWLAWNGERVMRILKRVSVWNGRKHS